MPTSQGDARRVLGALTLILGSHQTVDGSQPFQTETSPQPWAAAGLIQIGNA
jgi:hypothetical protein